MKTFLRRWLALPALCVLLLSFGCGSRGGAGGEGVRVIDAGKERLVPAACFNESAYLNRGYLKNTDAQGRVLYIYIPETDQKKDDTFIGKSGGETSFGGRAGRHIGNFRTFDYE